MTGFHKFDLQTVGEMKFLFEQVLEVGEIPLEQKNKMEFYVRYCDQLQKRMKQQMINIPEERFNCELSSDI